MMHKASLIFVGALAGTGLSLLATQPHTVFVESSARAASSDTYRQLNLFGEVFERCKMDVELAINGMLAGLDPHSSYMDPNSFRDIQVQTRGEFGGLGMEVTMEDGLVKVVAPIDETPAAKAGVMANDIITKLDDEQVQGLTLNQAVEKMRGPVNTKIKLTIMRKGADKPIDVTIVRDVIRVKSVRWPYRGRRRRLYPGYRFQRADHRRPEEGDQRSDQPARRREGQGLRSLGNNPGGLLDQAISVSDAFLDKGEIVLNGPARLEAGARPSKPPPTPTPAPRCFLNRPGASAA